MRRCYILLQKVTFFIRIIVILLKGVKCANYKSYRTQFVGIMEWCNIDAACARIPSRATRFHIHVAARLINERHSLHLHPCVTVHLAEAASEERREQRAIDYIQHIAKPRERP